jgi:hypothetical protein
MKIHHNCPRSSTLNEHSLKTKHHICINDAKIFAMVDHYLKCCMREAIKVNKNGNCVNRDNHLRISRSWTPIMHSLIGK